MSLPSTSSNNSSGSTSPISNPDERTSSEKVVRCPAELQEKEFEFWLRPENYNDIPSSVAADLYFANRIKIRQAFHHIFSETQVIPESFEKLCQSVVRHAFPHLISQKTSEQNWYAFLEYLVFIQDSDDFDDQEAEHQKKLELYDEKQVLMDILSKGTTKILDQIHTKRCVMRHSVAKGLKVKEHPKWVDFHNLSIAEQEAFRKAFIYRFHYEECYESSSRSGMDAIRKLRAKMEKAKEAKEAKIEQPKRKKAKLSHDD